MAVEIRKILYAAEAKESAFEEDQEILFQAENDDKETDAYNSVEY